MIVDICILIFIAFGAILGFKRGFTKEVLSAGGFILVLILSFLLKNPLSVLMYEYLPFFSFGFLKNVEIFNIIIYELLAFIVSFIILTILLKILLKISTLFEKILNATIILGIPSKILGSIVGILHHYVIVFVILFVLTLLGINYADGSKLNDKILNNTPILSNIINKSKSVINEFIVLKTKYNDKNISENKFNYDATELFLKYDVITTESLKKLFDSNKLEKFDGYEYLLDKYKGENYGN